MHDERRAAMYVSPDATEMGVPLQNVTANRAQKITDLAEARLGMESKRRCLHTLQGPS